MREKRAHVQQVLNVWAIILILWSLYRVKFRTDLPIWFDEFIAKPSIFLIPLWYFVTKIEKKEFFSAVSFRMKNIGHDVILGLAIGLIFFASGFFGVVVKHNELSTILSRITPGTILFFGALSLATGITEEILSRGFVLKELYDDSKNILSSCFLASMLFFFLHVPILFTSDKIIGYLLIRVMVTDLILSFTSSFIFIERKNIVTPILIHAFYNFSIYFFM
ncbi:MAG: CPBP family intramembrane metalloprotease [bacterium]|nr:CPBP family intramembrane metalloprotease [bacterium]